MSGIDYGHGMTNLDHDTGIRYGVISMHSIMQAWCDSSEPNYGPPCCPKCGNEAIESGELPEESEDWEIAPHACSDWGCAHCEYIFDSSEAYPEECDSWTYNQEGYEMTASGSDGFGIWVTKSPYYMRANFCSPCAPGAGNIDSDNDDGIATYCPGHDWFESGKAPYRVFRVSDDTEVFPE